jgi:hypothetical protein
MTPQLTQEMMGCFLGVDVRWEIRSAFEKALLRKRFRGSIRKHDDEK